MCCTDPAQQLIAAGEELLINDLDHDLSELSVPAVTPWQLCPRFRGKTTWNYSEIMLKQTTSGGHSNQDPQCTQKLCIPPFLHTIVGSDYSYIYIYILSSGGWVKVELKLPLPCIRYMCFNLSRRSRCNSSSRCCYRAREHVGPTWSRKIRCGGDSHPETPSSPGSVGLAQAHALTKTQAMEPSRQITITITIVCSPVILVWRVGIPCCCCRCCLLSWLFESRSPGDGK